MLNYRISEDDPAPHMNNLSSYLYISILVLPSWWWSDISLLLWQVVKAILPRQSFLHLLVISSVLNVVLIKSLGTLVFFSQMPPAKENTTFLSYFHVLPEKKSTFLQEEEIISIHKPVSIESSIQEPHGLEFAIAWASFGHGGRTTQYSNSVN